jgi:hypothetical protein
MSTDDKPSIAELQRDIEAIRISTTGWEDARYRVVNSAPVTLDIAAAALAYRQARKEAARVRHTYYRTWQSSLLSSVEKHDKEEIRCRDAFEAALAKVRE